MTAPRPDDPRPGHAMRWSEAASGAPVLDGAAGGLGDEPSWSRRMVRIALWLLAVGALGLLLIIVVVPIAWNSPAAGSFRADPEDFVTIRGSATVSPGGGDAVAAYHRPGHDPGGECTASGPDGEQAVPLLSTPLHGAVLDGEELSHGFVFDAPTSGEYTITCTTEGYIAGPAWTSDVDSPSRPMQTALLVLGFSAPGLLVASGIAIPLLLVALVIRLVVGRRAESARRRRADRPLALAVAAGLSALVGYVVLVLVAAGLWALWAQQSEPPEASQIIDLLGLLVAPTILLVVAVLAGVAAWARRVVRSRPGPRSASKVTQP